MSRTYFKALMMEINICTTFQNLASYSFCIGWWNDLDWLRQFLQRASLCVVAQNICVFSRANKVQPRIGHESPEAA